MTENEQFITALTQIYDKVKEEHPDWQNWKLGTTTHGEKTFIVAYNLDNKGGKHPAMVWQINKQNNWSKSLNIIDTGEIRAFFSRENSDISNSKLE